MLSTFYGENCCRSSVVSFSLSSLTCSLSFSNRCCIDKQGVSAVAYIVLLDFFSEKTQLVLRQVKISIVNGIITSENYKTRELSYKFPLKYLKMTFRYMTDIGQVS